MAEIDIAKIDPNMATKPAATEGIAWYLPFEKPMEVIGFCWLKENGKYERLPIAGRPDTVTQFPHGEKTTIPAAQCGAIILSDNTAGGQVRFRTDSTQFLIDADLNTPGGMDHMAFTGSAGFDVYLDCDGTWKCFGVTRADHSKTDFSTTVCSNLKKRMRDVIINFPLYNGVKKLSIGLDADAKLEAPTPFKDPRPIVFYGTSVTQGGCAMRPGMASSNIMSRMLARPVANLGFSGSGRGEPEIVAMLASIPDPAMYILDYALNVDDVELATTLPPFIDALRAKHPDTPILLVSPTPTTAKLELAENASNRHTNQRDTMRAETAKRNQQGDAKVFFFNAYDEALGDDYWETMVDGCHMTDFGFYRFSQAICPIINDILK